MLKEKKYFKGGERRREAREGKVGKVGKVGKSWKKWKKWKKWKSGQNWGLAGTVPRGPNLTKFRVFRVRPGTEFGTLVRGLWGTSASAAPEQQVYYIGRQRPNFVISASFHESRQFSRSEASFRVRGQFSRSGRLRGQFWRDLTNFNTC